MMVKVIHNADDFGYCNAVNYGIVDSYLQGVLTSTTIMAGMPGFAHAVALAKQNPGLGIGVHLTLTCGKPVLENHKTLIDESGNFKNLDFYKKETSIIDEKEIYAEWKAQIEKVLDSGLRPTHLDSHHHTHSFKKNPAIVMRLAKEYQLPVRNSFESPMILRKDEIKCNDILINPWIEREFEINQCEDKETALAQEICRLVRHASIHHNVIEVMWHPAYLDGTILAESSFAYPRIIEMKAIQNKELVRYFKENFELCTYQDI